ncbi:hypothetical protein OG963_43390 (plasmid) [Streptomyces sp. NBC_01707]|uniref:hypothetical protein n=1 Tax=Streptomyces sp. NBC_01707 TaxID=2975914 RepID=UPI002F909C99
MIHADPYMVRDHWMHQGPRGYAHETHEGYGRDLGRLDERGRSVDLAKLTEWKARRDATAPGEVFDETPPALGWIPFIAAPRDRLLVYLLLAGLRPFQVAQKSA